MHSFRPAILFSPAFPLISPMLCLCVTDNFGDLRDACLSVNNSLNRACMERPMAEVNSTSWGTSAIPLYDLPTPWQLKVVAGIYIWLVFAHVTSFTKHLRALVQPFVLRRVESGVPVLLAIQVLCVHYSNALRMQGRVLSAASFWLIVVVRNVHWWLSLLLNPLTSEGSRINYLHNYVFFRYHQNLW